MKAVVELNGFGGDFGHFAAVGGFFSQAVGEKLLANNFKAEIEFLGKFVDHNAASEDSGIGSVAIGISVLNLNVGVSLEEFDALVTSDHKVIRGVAIASINHAGGTDELPVKAPLVIVGEVIESVFEVLLDEIGLVGLAVGNGVLPGDK